MREAKALILGASASFRPEALKLIGQAFDQAWRQMAQDFKGDTVLCDGARVELAGLLLLIADNDCRNAEILTQAALGIMGRNHRRC